ncbi:MULTISPECIES: DUF3710 domain-containing protein [Dermabacter]|uniref:DUF3710 domain-containing protein n=1 Tax=Dermabacter TaxID=36739 RepID=UPI000774D6C0|nr:MULTISPECIES: DUF3710 domain-containing protein [Dermabacter]MCT1807384.1 DUF3710 domain-containing protein [Dermabacter hominis]MCT1954839.1 DUF3710 domain-containing protein [Dermabacter hominis]MCT2055995.1 DUF3710 domain-containing protein [Dermabacter hominis]MCT2082866.1 DUF3710 domain-containing protein [Dermabacter hominis]MCT2091865.1 DUF3710 domain-containing protein [Dermabacter hominis]
MGLFGRSKRKAAPAENVQASEESAPEPEEVKGPYDIADAPDDERLDFGSLQIPAREGMSIAVEVEQRSRAVTGLTLTYGDSQVQVNAFAAPKSEGLWDEIRKSLRESIASQGGTTETREGAFGTELYARIPIAVKGSNSRAHRPMRFVGIDGPRWFLRAVISGAALQAGPIREEIEDIIRSIVVVRGSMAKAPREVLELTIPGEGAATALPDETDPLGQGPTIAEVR